MFLDSAPVVTNSAACEAARVPLRDALAYGPELWDDLVASSPVPSPFMRWAWNSAWANAAAPEEVETSFAVVLNGSAGPARAVLPLSARLVSFRHLKARALTWAAGSVGYPDHLDVPAVPGADLGQMVPALETVPWECDRLERSRERGRQRRTAGSRVRSSRTRGPARRRRRMSLCGPASDVGGVPRHPERVPTPADPAQGAQARA